MDRTEQLTEVLDAVLARGDRSPAALAAQFGASNEGWTLALAAFASFIALDHQGADRYAVRAMEAASDPEARALARAAHGLGTAVFRHGARDSWAVPGVGGDVLAIAEAHLTELGTGATADFIRYLTAEAALACGRVGLARRVVIASGPLPLGFLAGHPFVTVIGIMRARVLVFAGLVADAATQLDELAGIQTEPVVALIISATESLVRGNAAERAEVRALAARLESARLQPDDYLSSGCYLLVAFGLVAVGDLRRSARLALAGGRGSLARLTLIDRVLTLELLMVAALADDDLDSADAWWAEAAPLRDDPIANSTVARMASRAELAHGRPASALAEAERAIALAQAEGRAIEAAEGEVLAARARIRGRSSGEAASRLNDLVEVADSRGHAALRLSAARELRTAGRRLPPVPGSEWDGLSRRERDIALMVAEGMTNREIGAALHLSEHTVRAHVSRVLAAFAAASRFAVAARLAELFPEPPRDYPAALTPRQQSVARCVAQGLGNAEIGSELGLSVKTVERNISEILHRWGVASRVGIARSLIAGGGRE